MKSKQHDYLKYWKVVRQFIKSKYGLTQAELDILLFLYSEDYFSRDKFFEFNNILSWDVVRFQKLKANGWIETFRKHGGGRKALYMLSIKTNNMISFMYKVLNGEEIPTTIGANPMFKRDVKYSEKVYRNLILEMNKFIRQQRHLTRE